MCSLEKKDGNMERKKTRTVFGVFYMRECFLMRPGGASSSSSTGAAISGFILCSLSSASPFYRSALLFAPRFVSISAISLYCCLEKAIVPSLTESAGKPTQ